MFSCTFAGNAVNVKQEKKESEPLVQTRRGLKRRLTPIEDDEERTRSPAPSDDGDDEEKE